MFLLLLACTHGTSPKETGTPSGDTDPGTDSPTETANTTPDTETGAETATDTETTTETATETGTPTQCNRGTWTADAGTYPKPEAPSLPTAGSTALDPTFGSTILRVTDESIDPNGCVHAYSYWPPFNSDSTLILAYCNSIGLTATPLDPATLTLGPPVPLSLVTSQGTGATWEDVIWSDRDPDLLYLHDDARLWSLAVSTGTWTLLRDFTTELGAEKLKQMSRGGDDDVFAWHTDDRRGGTLGYLVYRRSDDQVIARASLDRVDEVHIDKSGRYLGILPGQQGSGVVSYQVLDTETGLVTDLIDDVDLSPGHADYGTGTNVGYSHWSNSFLVRSLSVPHTWVEALSFGNDWTLASHLSMLADDEDWALISTYAVSTSTGPFHDEILQVRTDGSGELRRIAHHQSTYADYWDSPRAAISRDGCLAAFTSNWGDSGRTDVYVVALDR